MLKSKKAILGIILCAVTALCFTLGVSKLSTPKAFAVEEQSETIFFVPQGTAESEHFELYSSDWESYGWMVGDQGCDETLTVSVKDGNNLMITGLELIVGKYGEYYGEVTATSGDKQEMGEVDVGSTVHITDVNSTTVVLHGWDHVDFKDVTVYYKEVNFFYGLQELIYDAPDGGTITLDKDYTYGGYMSNDQELCIQNRDGSAKTLTIDLNGHKIDGNGAYYGAIIVSNRAFTDFSDLTLIDGSQEGGGTVTNCGFYNDGEWYNGYYWFDGVYVPNGATFTAENVIFYNCGTAISSFGEVTATNCQFIDNYDYSIMVDEDVKVEISGCLFKENVEEDEEPLSCSISIYNGEVKIKDCDFEGVYDGIFAYSPDESIFLYVEIIDCEFTDCYSYAIDLDENAIGIIKGCVITGSETGIYTYYETAIIDTTVTDCETGVNCVYGDVYFGGSTQIVDNDYNIFLEKLIANYTGTQAYPQEIYDFDPITIGEGIAVEKLNDYVVPVPASDFIAGVSIYEVYLTTPMRYDEDEGEWIPNYEEQEWDSNILFKPFTTNGTPEDAKYFFADESDCFVVYGDGCLELIEISKVEDIFKTNPDFPTTLADAWKSANGASCFYSTKRGAFVFGDDECFAWNGTTLVKNGDNFVYVDNGITGSQYSVTFVMDDGELTSIVFANNSGFEAFDGTYLGGHVHDFTYSSDGNVLIATCSNEYGNCPLTDCKLTLTLVCPTDLTYNGKGKAVTFADGESTAWEEAGLALPEIVYTKMDGLFFYPYDGIPTETGTYFAVIYVGGDGINAYTIFSIFKAEMVFGENFTPPCVPFGELRYDGTPLNLLEEGITYDEKDFAPFGTFYYSLDGENWSTEIPTAILVGEYNPVWYFVGDANHGNIGSSEEPIAQYYPIEIIGLDQNIEDVTISGFTYGENVMPQLNTENLLDNPTVTFYYSDTNTNEEGIKWEEGTSATLNAGTYYAYAVVSHTDVYQGYTTEPVAFTVAKATGEIFVDTTAINVTEGETFTLPTATSNFGTVTCDKTVEDLKVAGTYTVTYTLAEDNNYTGDVKTLTVVVNAKQEPPIEDPQEQDDTEDKGAPIGLIIVCVVAVLVIVYVLGYFFMYKKGKLEGKMISVIYNFLP